MRKRSKRVNKKVIGIIIILLIILAVFIEKSFANTQNVVVSITQKPKIDIVLAKSKTKTDVTNFKDEISSELKAQNIDISDVVISAVQAEQIDLTKNFTWKNDVSSSIGSISITNNGQSVVMTGNRTLSGKNAIWIMPDKQNEDQHFTLFCYYFWVTY